MLKIGEKVKVIKNSCGHRFKIGSIISVEKIEQVNDEGHVTSFIGKGHGGKWWLSEEEVEKIEND